MYTLVGPSFDTLIVTDLTTNSGGDSTPIQVTPANSVISGVSENSPLSRGDT